VEGKEKGELKGERERCIGSPISLSNECSSRSSSTSGHQRLNQTSHFPSGEITSLDHSFQSSITDSKSRYYTFSKEKNPFSQQPRQDTGQAYNQTEQSQQYLKIESNIIIIQPSFLCF